ncbi:MAG: caspase family protein [Bacteroidetes bacterium]|nr:caspase family protein [Bacteroidota bacterium]
MKKTFLIIWCLLISTIASPQEHPQLVLPVLDLFDITGIHFVPGKNLLVSYGSDENLKIWQVGDGKQLAVIALESYEKVNDLSFSPDGKTMAFITTYNRIYWTNTEDFSMQMIEGMAESDAMLQFEFTSCAFSPDGKTLYLAGGNYFEVAIWTIPILGEKTTKIIQTAGEPQEMDASGADPVKGIKRLIVSPNGKSIFLTAGKKTIYQFNVANRSIQKLPGTAANDFALLPDGQMLVSLADNDKTQVKLLNQSLQTIGNFQVPFPVVGLSSFPRSGKCIVAGADRYAVLDIQNRKAEGPFILPVQNIRQISIDEHESNIAYGGVSDELSRLAIRNLKSNSDVVEMGIPLFQAGKIFSNTDASWYLTAKSFPGHIKTFHIQQGTIQIKTLPMAETIGQAALGNKRQAVFWEYGRQPKTFDASAQDVRYQTFTEIKPDNGLVFSEETSRAAVLTNYGIYVYDVAKGHQVAHLLHRPESKEVNQMYYAAFSPDGRFLVASYGAYNTIMGVKCWDLSTGSTLWHLEKSEFDNFKYSADGKQIICIENGRTQRAVRWLEASTGQTLKTTPIDMPQTKMLKVVYAPDNSTFLDLDRLVLYETNSGRKLQKYVPNGKPYGATLMANGYYALVAYTSSAPEDYLISKIVLYDFSKNLELATLYLFDDSNDWVLITPGGHYDATPGAMQRMYYRQGRNLIGLDALADRFYYPRLFAKLLDDYTPPSNDNINKIKLPPVVKIGIPTTQRNLIVEEEVTNIRNYTVQHQHIKLNVEATALDDIVEEIRLFQNGKLVQRATRNLVIEDDPGRSMITIEFELSLIEGENHFRAIAINSQRTESAPDAIIVNYKPASKPEQSTADINLHAVVIGINEYKNPRYNLNYANADANEFAQVISYGASKLFKEIKVHRLSDKEATRDGIISSLEQVAKAAMPQDVFVFYYAGHGVLDDQNQFFLVPHEVSQLYGNAEMLAKQGISAQTLQFFAKEIKAQKQLFLLDACQSAGALHNALAMRGAAEERAIAQLARSTGTHWLTASGSEQFAAEFVQLGHGVFTYTLLEGLKGKADNGDNKITVKEIDAFVQQMVPELSARYKGSPQYPASFGFGNDFPIVVLR